MIAQLDKSYLRNKPSKVISRLISFAFFEGRPATTKGRWINRLVFLNYQIASSLPKLKKIDKPIFILGTGRSGTTILGKILSLNKDVGFLNEPKALWHFIYPYEDIIGSYSMDKAFYRLEDRNVDNETINIAHKLYGFYLLLSASSRVVDKYPELIFRTKFVKAIFPDAKFIFIVRNGWDTCASIKHWSERKGKIKGNETEDWWGINNRKWHLLVNQLVAEDNALKSFLEQISNFNNHIDMAATEWIVTMKEGLKLLKIEKNILMLKYEDLVSQTEKTLRMLLDFCELRRDTKIIKYAKEILGTPSPKNRFDLHESIIKEFKRVVSEIGYENNP